MKTKLKEKLSEDFKEGLSEQDIDNFIAEYLNNKIKVFREVSSLQEQLEKWLDIPESLQISEGMVVGIGKGGERGDFVKVIPLPQGELIIKGDVMGHGEEANPGRLAVEEFIRSNEEKLKEIFEREGLDGVVRFLRSPDSIKQLKVLFEKQGKEFRLLTMTLVFKDTAGKIHIRSLGEGGIFVCDNEGNIKESLARGRKEIGAALMPIPIKIEGETVVASNPIALVSDGVLEALHKETNKQLQKNPAHLQAVIKELILNGPSSAYEKLKSLGYALEDDITLLRIMPSAKTIDQELSARYDDWMRLEVELRKAMKEEPASSIINDFNRILAKNNGDLIKTREEVLDLIEARSRAWKLAYPKYWELLKARLENWVEWTVRYRAGVSVDNAIESGNYEEALEMGRRFKEELGFDLESYVRNRILEPYVKFALQLPPQRFDEVIKEFGSLRKALLNRKFRERLLEAGGLPPSIKNALRESGNAIKALECAVKDSEKREILTALKSEFDYAEKRLREIIEKSGIRTLDDLFNLLNQNQEFKEAFTLVNLIKPLILQGGDSLKTAEWILRSLEEGKTFEEIAREYLPEIKPEVEIKPLTLSDLEKRVEEAWKEEIPGQPVEDLIRDLSKKQNEKLKELNRNENLRRIVNALSNDNPEFLKSAEVKEFNLDNLARAYQFYPETALNKIKELCEKAGVDPTPFIKAYFDNVERLLLYRGITVPFGEPGPKEELESTKKLIRTLVIHGLRDPRRVPFLKLLEGKLDLQAQIKFLKEQILRHFELSAISSPFVSLTINPFVVSYFAPKERAVIIELENPIGIPTFRTLLPRIALGGRKEYEIASIGNIDFSAVSRLWVVFKGKAHLVYEKPTLSEKTLDLVQRIRQGVEIYKSKETGKRYYVKVGRGPKPNGQVFTEACTLALLKALGVDVPPFTVLRLYDQWRIATEEVVDAETLDQYLLKNNLRISDLPIEIKRQLWQNEIFMWWINNWDGVLPRNYLITPEGKLVVIDTGGSFNWRALGEMKDWVSRRDWKPGISESLELKEFYESKTPEAIQAKIEAIEKILALPDIEIYRIVQGYFKNYDDPTLVDKIVNTLVQRKSELRKELERLKEKLEENQLIASALQRPLLQAELGGKRLSEALREESFGQRIIEGGVVPYSRVEVWPTILSNILEEVKKGTRPKDLFGALPRPEIAPENLESFARVFDEFRIRVETEIRDLELRRETLKELNKLKRELGIKGTRRTLVDIVKSWFKKEAPPSQKKKIKKSLDDIIEVRNLNAVDKHFAKLDELFNNFDVFVEFDSQIGKMPVRLDRFVAKAFSLARAYSKTYSDKGYKFVVEIVGGDARRALLGELPSKLLSDVDLVIRIYKLVEGKYVDVSRNPQLYLSDPDLQTFVNKFVHELRTKAYKGHPIAEGAGFDDIVGRGFDALFLQKSSTTLSRLALSSEGKVKAIFEFDEKYLKRWLEDVKNRRLSLSPVEEVDLERITKDPTKEFFELHGEKFVIDDMLLFRILRFIVEHDLRLDKDLESKLIEISKKRFKDMNYETEPGYVKFFDLEKHFLKLFLSVKTKKERKAVLKLLKKFGIYKPLKRAGYNPDVLVKDKITETDVFNALKNLKRYKDMPLRILSKRDFNKILFLEKNLELTGFETDVLFLLFEKEIEAYNKELPEEFYPKFFAKKLLSIRKTIELIESAKSEEGYWLENLLKHLREKGGYENQFKMLEEKGFLRTTSEGLISITGGAIVLDKPDLAFNELLTKKIWKLTFALFDEFEDCLTQNDFEVCFYSYCERSDVLDGLRLIKRSLVVNSELSGFIEKESFIAGVYC